MGTRTPERSRAPDEPSSPPSGRPAPAAPALPVTAAVLLLFVAATAIQTMQVLGAVSEPVGTAVGLMIGTTAVAVLLAAGWAPQDCYLGPGRLSARGALAIGWLLVLWPFVLATGEWVGWDTGRAVTQALGGIAQELYFRAALLPLLVALLRGRTWVALLVHAVLFTIWHGGAVLVTPPEAAAGAVALLVVAFLAGISWGWQTLHDGTVRWAMAHHALLWVVGSLFLLAPPE